MDKEELKTGDTCLNCGSDRVGNYCADCGQKFQPTKLPINLFLEDAAETLFNIDNRFYRTIRDLFVKPGKVTKEYIEGKRAKYLPPLRIYVSISLVYFLLAQFIESDKILFVNFTQDDEGVDVNLAKVVQTALFFLVPVMAGIVSLLHRKRKAYYIEYLIFSIHIHSVWFVLFTVQLLLVALSDALATQIPEWLSNLIYLIGEASQAVAMIFLILWTKKVFEESWVKAILKGISGLFLYLLALALTTFIAIMIL